MNEDELQHLAQELGEMVLAGLGVRSRWALRTAIDAARTEGISGVLVVTVPAKERDYCEVSFTVGIVDIIERWGK